MRRLHAAWGVTICRSSLPFVRGCRVGVWFGFVRAASCGWNVRRVGVRGDAWPVLLSPCNTIIHHRVPEGSGYRGESLVVRVLLGHMFLDRCTGAA